MTTFSGIRQIGATQVTNSGATSNDADADLVNGLADVQAEVVDSSNAFTITNIDPTWLWERNITWIFSDDSPAPTAQITVTVPASPARAMFNVINLTGQTILVEITSQPVTGPTITTGSSAVLCNDGTNVRVIARS